MPEPLAGEGAWNPGLESSIPTHLLPQITLFCPEHATVSFAEARELADFTGLPLLELVSLRPERLVVHELLVRVTADLSVSDGPSYEELGLNLRSMVAGISERHVAPQMATVVAAFDALRHDAEACVGRELDGWAFWGAPARPVAGRVDQTTVTDSSGGAAALDSETPVPWWRRLFSAPDTSSQTPESTPTLAHSHSDELPEMAALTHWKEALAETRSANLPPLEQACLQGLVKVVGAVVGHRGRLVADRELVTRLVVNQVGNTRGARVISEVLAPIFDQAVLAEGFRLLPAQDKPTVMNVKGASASGKSTIRPRQRELADKLGIAWEDFALISPDYWRKYLLDYPSLGEHYKYGAMLTGQELEIIDKKLDRHMAAKAAAGHMSHLLIDRFRFDSFLLEQDRTAGSRLLSRFGDRLYLFFMITPPQETVQRAWSRGLTTGRFKAVDDLLFHNVEAYTGMPALFLSWINPVGKQVHFEFLDNDVPLGEIPATVAFGRNDYMTILDVQVLMNIDRYRKVDIHGRSPDQVQASVELPGHENLAFIRQCADTIARMDLADQSTARVYACVRGGKLVWWDAAFIEAQPDDSDVKIALEALGYADDSCVEPDLSSVLDKQVPTVIDVDVERRMTVGRWGTAV